MEAKVLETLGDVDSLDAVLLELAGVEDEFMSDESIGAFVEDAVVILQPLHHVVGVEDGQLGSLPQSPGSHHLDVSIGDGKDG